MLDELYHRTWISASLNVWCYTKKEETRQEAVRVFLSVHIPDTVKQELQALQARLRSRTKNIRWIDSENMHITLKFIGKYPESELERIHTAMQPAAASIKSFELELGGFGTFPPVGNPAVLWIGVLDGEKQLMALAESITVALMQSDIPADPKPFVPHLTLGRAKRDLPVYVPNGIQIPVSNTRFQVESFYLMESVLHPQGAVYTERAEFQLKG